MTSPPTFTPPNPITGGIDADRPYWTALNAGEFRISACAGCGHWQWPAHFRCGSCGSWELDWRPVEPRGSVYSWTRTHMPFPRVHARSTQIPYVTALVEIDGLDGVRVFGILDASDVSMGMRVYGDILPPDESSFGYPSLQWVPETAGSGGTA